MFTKSPLFQPTSSGQSQIRPCRIEPFRWNKNHLDAIGATLTFDLHLDSSTALKPAFIDAVLNTLSPFSKLFRSIHHTNALQNIAKSSYRLTMIPPGPRDVEPRRYACVELVEHVLRYFCTSYDWPLFPLKLRYQEITVTWDPRGFIGSRVWLVVPRRRSPDFAEEAAYAVSLAQEFMDRDAQQEFAVWLVTVRAGSGAVVKATVSGALIKALETNGQVSAGCLVGPEKGLRMEVSKEYRISDLQERMAFSEVLAELAQLANSMCERGSSTYTAAASWPW